MVTQTDQSEQKTSLQYVAWYKLLDRGGNRTRDLWFASPIVGSLV